MYNRTVHGGLLCEIYLNNPVSRGTEAENILDLTSKIFEKIETQKGETEIASLLSETYLNNPLIRGVETENL